MEKEGRKYETIQEFLNEHSSYKRNILFLIKDVDVFFFFEKDRYSLPIFLIEDPSILDRRLMEQAFSSFQICASIRPEIFSFYSPIDCTDFNPNALTANPMYVKIDSSTNFLPEISNCSVIIVNERLSSKHRDQLFLVAAHEFGHIFERYYLKVERITSVDQFYQIILEDKKISEISQVEKEKMADFFAGFLSRLKSEDRISQSLLEEEFCQAGSYGGYGWRERLSFFEKGIQAFSLFSRTHE